MDTRSKIITVDNGNCHPINIRNVNAAEQSVHPTGGSLRVFKQFLWLEVDPVKVALSRPAHQRVTPAVGRFAMKFNRERRQVICWK